MNDVHKVEIVNKGGGLATAGLVLGIIAIVFAFIPIINFISYILGSLALIFGIIAVIKKSGGKAIAALVLGILSLTIAVAMNMAVFNAAKTVVDDINESINNAQEEQEENTANWTEEIYNSIATAESKFSADYSSIEYSGGTMYSEIESKVGEPSSTTSIDMSGRESVTASWTTLDFSGNGESLSITITYDKDSGQITSKNKLEF